MSKKQRNLIGLIILGVLLAIVVPLILENKRIRSRAESVCTVFSKTDQSICRHSINYVLDLSEEDFENYLQTKGVEK